MSTDDEFFGIANELVGEEVNDLLEKQLARVMEWRQMRQHDGEPANLMDLIKQVHREKNKRGPILAAYCAAMWRLLEQRGDL